MILNKLPESVLAAADRTHVWFNVILGLVVSASIALERTWETDPVWTVMRYVPWSRGTWSLTLLFAVLVYTTGSFMSYSNRFRGGVVMIGSMLCALWFFAATLCMVRVSYVVTTHVTGLWPILMFFFAALYAHRAILYANMFTGSRWSLNPFQLYSCTFLMFASLAQVVIGVSPGSVQAQFDKGAQLSLAGANLVGAVTCLIGLHLRNLDTGLWIELWGYASLTVTLAFYCYQILISYQGPIATLGFTLSEAFVFASLHRAIQIFSLKLAEFRKDYERQDKLKPLLTHRTDEMLTIQADERVK